MTELFFWILAAAAGLQDLRTRYFSPFWLLPALLFLCLVPLRLSWSLVFCALVTLLRLWHPDMIGSADPIVLLFLSLVTGSGLYLLVAAACLAGLAWSVLTREKSVPFVSCLCAGAILLAGLS